MNKEQNNVHVLQLSAYTTPVIQESKKEDWVEYGADNNYYQYLIDRYTGSATNNAVINNIVNLIYGKGLSARDAARKPNDYAQMITLFPKDEVRKMVSDLKMLGGAMIQVIYSKDRKKITNVYHSPVQLWRSAKCDENGEINGYWYSDNWSDTKKFPPKFVSKFGTSTDGLEVMFIRPYAAGMKYYSYPDYQGALPYALLEQEIADYLINEVQNGFSGTKVVNFNNGIPSTEQQEVISRKVLGKLTGSRGQKVVIAFNDNQESRTTVDDIPLNDAPEHYQYLSEECQKKIMVSHNVTSPLLFGLGSANGFSSNADEIRNATVLFENMVLQPKRNLLIDSFDTILAYNGVALDLYFESLNPLDAAGDLTTETEGSKVIEAINSLSPLVANKVLESMTPEEIRSLVGLEGSGVQQPTQMSVCCSSHSEDEEGNDDAMFNEMQKCVDEIDLDEYELIDSRPVDYDEEDVLDLAIKNANNPNIIKQAMHFVSTGTAYPKRKSEQDGELFISRYRYSGDISDNSREFCRKMIKANKLYRKEDIISMGSQVVNEGWGARGADTYSIWLYKGGGACHHFWTRETYRKKGTDINSPLAKQVTPAEARKAGEILPTNDKKVYTKPIDMPNQGFLPK